MSTSELLVSSALNAVIELNSPLVLFSPSPDVSLVHRLRSRRVLTAHPFDRWDVPAALNTRSGAFGVVWVSACLRPDERVLSQTRSAELQANKEPEAHPGEVQSTDPHRLGNLESRPVSEVLPPSRLTKTDQRRAASRPHALVAPSKPGTGKYNTPFDLPTSIHLVEEQVTLATPSPFPSPPPPLPSPPTAPTHKLRVS